jgi:hypothetical protein
MQLCMGRLVTGALMSDTCNTAQATKRLMQEHNQTLARARRIEEMGQQAWDALGDEKQKHKLRVHLLDCSQHMRDIFLKEMSSAMAKPSTWQKS